MTTLATPGQVVGNLSTHIAGPGTHVHDTDILASIVGSTITIPPSTKQGKPTLSIPRQPSLSQSKSNLLPELNSTVLCRVTRVQQRQLTASILLVLPSPTSQTPPPSTILSYTSTTSDALQHQALLRREDVRSYEKDKIVLNDMFRVGDIVRATVISLGDERNYYISTAGNELGVVVARSETGNAMVPVSWKEMRDVVTGKGEGRKVAKPV